MEFQCRFLLYLRDLRHLLYLRDLRHLLYLRDLRFPPLCIATNGGSIPGRRNRGCMDAMIVFGYADTLF